MDRLDGLEQQGVIGDVQKGVGDMMRGALIETGARAIITPVK